MLKVLFVFNSAEDVLASRLPIIKAAINFGYQVEVAVPEIYKIPIENYPNIVFHELYLNRKSINPWCQLKTIFRLKKIFKKVKPDLIHIFKVKLILYGAFLARLMKIPSVVCVFTGLGYLFTQKSLKVSFLRSVVKFGFRWGLNHPNIRVIFQNSDDPKEFIENGIVTPERTIIIKGSGVDLEKFIYLAEPLNAIPKVLLFSRMLWDKGIAEFVEAARIIYQQNIKAEFLLVGDTDPLGITGVPIEQLQAWNKEDFIEWRPAVKSEDVPGLIQSVNIVCLPSYREGLPRVLLEGAACGRALVTTDVHGCREVVKDQINGLLVPAIDANNLADALLRLILDPEKRQQMGKQSRLLIEEQFSLAHVIDENLKIYADLLAR